MTVSPSIAAIDELRSSTDHDSQIRLLRTVKNDIVGHLLRKELVVRHGLLALLCPCIDLSFTDDGDFPSSSEIALQAILITGSLTRGGKTFLAPLLASNILSRLLKTLHSADHRLVAATLRTLNSWATAWNSKLCDEDSTSQRPPFQEQVFRPSCIQDYLSILDQQKPDQTRLVCDFIAKSCVDDVSRSTLVSAGMLSALENKVTYYSTSNTALLAPLFDAISAIIVNSPYRTYRFIFSLRKSRTMATLDDHALPQIPPAKSKPKSRAFPASTLRVSRPVEYPEFALAASNSMRLWLICLARDQSSKLARLSTLRLLACLNAVTDGSESHARHKSIHLLAIPLIVEIVRDIALSGEVRPIDVDQTLYEETPLVLAELVGTNRRLQQAAAEAGANKYLSMLFRQTFTSVQTTKPIWTSSPNEYKSDDPSCVMGPLGLSDQASHIMRVRAACLQALNATAMARLGEGIAKSQLEQGIVARVVECLDPQNTATVIKAACCMLRAISHDVSQARTTLVDAHITAPIMILLKHSDVPVTVAALDLCINLLLEHCPVRQELLDAGIISVLCEHVKSSEVTVQVASLWALRHLVIKLPKDLRIQIFDSLGPEFFIKILEPGQLSATEILDAAADDLSMFEDADHQELLQLLQQWEGSSCVEKMRCNDLIQVQALDFLANICLPPMAEDIMNHLDNEFGPQRVFNWIRSRFEAPILDWEAYSSLRSWRRSDGTPQYYSVSIKNVLSAMRLLCHIAATSDHQMNQIMACKPLLLAFMRQIPHSESEIRLASVFTVIRLTLPETHNAANARSRAQELRELGVEEHIRALTEDDSLDIRQQAKTAVDHFNQLLHESRAR